MTDFYDEVNVLVNRIICGRIDQKCTEQTIEELKKKYGDSAFPSFSFEKKTKPWNREYFNQLVTKNVTGACSADFIIHMAEVSDYLLKKKRTMIGGIIVSIIVAIAFIILLVTSS